MKIQLRNHITEDRQEKEYSERKRKKMMIWKVFRSRGEYSSTPATIGAGLSIYYIYVHRAEAFGYIERCDSLYILPLSLSRSTARVNAADKRSSSDGALDFIYWKQVFRQRAHYCSSSTRLLINASPRYIIAWNFVCICIFLELYICIHLHEALGRRRWGGGIIKCRKYGCTTAACEWLAQNKTMRKFWMYIYHVPRVYV